MDDKEEIMYMLEEIRQWFNDELYEGNCWSSKVERVMQYVNDQYK
jgi:hypothetical protein